MVAIIGGSTRVNLRLDTSWVTQCALSRICGICGESLGRPIVVVGTIEEVGRNAFHAPPLHSRCAAELMDTLTGGPGDDHDWHVVATAAFEFVRPARDDEDRRPTFQPSALISAG